MTVQQRFLYETNALSSLLPLGGEGARRADEAANWEPVIVLDERLAGEPYQEVDHRYMNGPAIDQVFADETGGNGVLWYLSDTQNTVRDVAKYASTAAGTQATVRNHLEYNTFGIVTTADDPTTATVNDGDRPGLEGTGNEFSPQRSYTGREPDTATGLIYYRARWFDPRIGRFISEDPIGFAAGDANLSRYVGNSTPNAVDPSGLDEWRPVVENSGREVAVYGQDENIVVRVIDGIPLIMPFENFLDHVDKNLQGDAAWDGTDCYVYLNNSCRFCETVPNNFLSVDTP